MVWDLRLHGDPGGPTSIARRARVALAIFYIVTPSLSGHTIESTFATLRHRTVKVKGAFSNESALGMLYQLGLEAEKSWRRITGHERIAEVISGVAFVNGVRADTA